MATLKIQEKGKEREIRIAANRLTIGRLPDNDVVLVDETVSRHHAELISVPDGYKLKDLATRNGTCVNGKLIKEAILSEGDTIKIGTAILTFKSRESQVFYEAKEKWLDNPSTTIRPPAGPSIAVSDHKKLEILYNISQAVNSIFDIKELAKKVAEEVLGVMKGDRFLLMLKDEKTSEFIPQMAIGRDEKEVELTISRTMIQRVTTEGVSILVRDTYEDSFFREAQSLISKNICSILCAPLLSKEGIIGLIYVDTNKREKAFSEDELDLFTAIGNHVAAAFQNIRMQEKLWQRKRFERELEIAAEIQQSFLPRSFPPCAGYEFGIKSIPAQNVGGDFYDCFSISPAKIGLVVGDVSGKGVPAALYMARFISEFKIMSRNFTKSALLMNEMNKRFRDIAVGGNFVSAAYLVLDINSGTVDYTMAGCHPILFYNNKKNKFIEAEICRGPILGIGECVFGGESLILGSGDMIILYTDGLIEAKNRGREEFGVRRLKDIVTKFKKFKADEIVEKVIEAVFEFSEKRDLSDDLTLLILKKG